jgi:hypothetical protein
VDWWAGVTMTYILYPFELPISAIAMIGIAIAA